MGASHSTDKDDKKYCLVDYGTWTPLGLYEENDECDLKLVRELISAKRLAPFYKGLSSPTQQCFHNEIITKDTRKLVKPKDYSAFIKKHEKTVFDNIYFNSVECPLCFLFYPGNINYARCCDQPICTECFVQLKKAPADSTKQMACPYCMTLDFGIIYQKPKAVTEKNIQIISTTSGHCQKKLTKRKTIESDNPDVVLIDHVRKQDMNEKDLLIRANSLHTWFQSRSVSPSLDRHLSSLRVETMSLQDIMVIDSIRQSLIDKEQSRLNI